MKTIKLKNVVLFAFAFAATAFVSSCSSDDDMTNTSNILTITKDTTLTFTFGTSDKLSGGELTRASVADAATPILEQNVDLGNGFAVSGTQIVDETVMNTVTRGTMPAASHLKLTDLKPAAGAYNYNQSNTGTHEIKVIKCYWFKSNGDSACFSGTKKSRSDIPISSITEKNDTLTGVVSIPANAAKVVMYIGDQNKTLSDTISYSTIKVDEVEATKNKTVAYGDRKNGKRGKPNNTTNIFEAFYAGNIPADKTILFTRLAARIRIVLRACKTSDYQSGSRTMYFTYWRFYLNNMGSSKYCAYLRGDAMKNVPITDPNWNTSYDPNSIDWKSDDIESLAYLHSDTGSDTDVNEDRKWYESQRDDSGEKYASNTTNGDNTWLSLSTDKQYWHDRFDVWYNFIPYRGATPTGLYTGKEDSRDDISENKSDVFVIQQNETNVNNGCVTGLTSASDNNDVIFKVSSIGGSSYQIFKPGHSYTLYVYMKFVKGGTVNDANVDGIKAYDWSSLY